MKILQFRRANKGIGLVTRRSVEGPEKELVNKFLQYVPQCFRWRSGDVAIFEQPQIDTGFPDLVVVHYEPATFRRWARARRSLTPVDLKVLHHLYRTDGADSRAISRRLGLKGSDLMGSLERLLDSDLIRRAGRKWQPHPLRHAFGIRAIVAIEAKVKDWSSVFHQACLNQWFASESYVLSPVEKPTQSVVDRCRKRGIGVFLMNGNRVRRISTARKQDVPSCYCSWLFNEWIGRRLYQRARGS